METSIKRIGIFAGTFDPVHHGHVAFAQAAIDVCNLDEVIFLPEPKPRGKTQVTDVRHRLVMLNAAIAGKPGMRVVTLPDDKFTVARTLPELEQLFPGAHFALLTGTDVARGLPHWPGVEELLKKVELIVGVRQGDEAPKGLVATTIPTDHAHVTARHIRGGISDDVAPSVRNYIKKHGLYQV